MLRRCFGMGHGLSTHRRHNQARVCEFTSCVHGNDDAGLKRLLQQTADTHQLPHVDLLCVDHPACSVSLDAPGSLFFAPSSRVARHAREISGWTPLPCGTPLMYAIYHGHGAIARQLLAAGADPNACNVYGTTPLMLAVRHHLPPDVIRALIAHGADVNVHNSGGDTALTMAVEEDAREGRQVLVEELLRGGADVNLAGPEGRTPLMIAAQHGDVNIASRLLSVVSFGAGVNVSGRMSVSIPRSNSYKNLNAVVEVRADVNARDNAGRTPLMHALVMDCVDKVDDSVRRERGGHGEVALQLVRLLLSRGADPNARDSRGCSVLKRAMLIHANVKGRGRLERMAGELVDFLLASGADGESDVSRCGVDGWEGMGLDATVDSLIASVPLTGDELVRFITSPFANDLDVRRILWRCRGAPHVDTMCVNTDCELFLEYVRSAFITPAPDELASSSNSSRSSIGSHGDGSSGAVGRGVGGSSGSSHHPAAVVHHFRFDAHACFPGTLLMYAADVKKGNTARHLLDAGANPNVSDEHGRTPLMHAVTRRFNVPLMRHFHVAQELIRGGADVNARRFNDGKTALMIAVLQNVFEGGEVSGDSLPLIELLLAHGADINVEDGEGRSALVMAVSNRDYAAVEAMLKCAPMHASLENLRKALEVNRDAGRMASLLVVAEDVASDGWKKETVAPSVVRVQSAKMNAASAMALRKVLLSGTGVPALLPSLLPSPRGGRNGTNGGSQGVLHFSSLPAEVLNHIVASFPPPRMPLLARLTLVCKVLDECVPLLELAPTHLLLVQTSCEALVRTFFPDLPQAAAGASPRGERCTSTAFSSGSGSCCSGGGNSDGGTGASAIAKSYQHPVVGSNGKWLRRLSRGPVRSQDGCFAIEVDRTCERIKFHVSAAACFSVAGADASWEYGERAAGSFFRRCIHLLRDDWMALRGVVAPPFCLPPGRYAVGWRVRRRKTIRDREQQKQLPRCKVLQHEDQSEVEDEGLQRWSRHMLVAVPVGGSDKWHEVTICGLDVEDRHGGGWSRKGGPCENGSDGCKGNVALKVLLEEQCAAYGEEEENLEIDSLFFTLLEAFVQ